MALSERARKALEIACPQGNASSNDGSEIADAIDIGFNAIPASNIPALGSTANMTALVPAAASISNSTSTAVDSANPTMTEVNTAVDAASAKVITALGLKADNVDAETLRTEAEARLDAIEAKIDAIIAAMIVAGLMSA
jgi:hypothetical protein